MARLERSPVQVTWHDAHSLDNNEWHDLADIDDVPLVCVSIGILIRHKRHCVLIQTSTADQGADNVLLIPWGMVQKIEKLQIPHKKRKRR
jgi:hypothetical protein